jgi:predicted dehydrogenase
MSDGKGLTGGTRIGVVGTGHLGSLHAKMLHEIDAAGLVGVFDTDPERCRAVARACGTTAFSGLPELLGGVDALCIATPTSTHAGIAGEALRAGKHVFIEKPITRTVPEAAALIALARERGVKLQVGHIERFNPAILALGDQRLEPMFVESHRLAGFNPRSTDVDVVLDLMIHDIDIIVSLVGSDVATVDASGVAVVSENLDIANARIAFTNGCVANVTASRISQKKMRKMRLFQRDAYISIDFLKGVSELFRLTDGTGAAGKGTRKLGQIDTGAKKRTIVYQKPKIKKINPLKYELEQFIECILHDRKPPVTGEDGLVALSVAGRIIGAINNRTITL